MEQYERVRRHCGVEVDVTGMVKMENITVVWTLGANKEGKAD